MDQERLRALAVPVLLQILQQVVLEISTPMMELVEVEGVIPTLAMDVEHTMIVLWLEVEVILLLVPAFWSLWRANTTKLAINTTRATNTELVGIDAWMTSLFKTMAWSRTLP